MENKGKSYSNLNKDFSTKITLEGETYNIETEDLGMQNPNIITHIYHKGKIISSNKISYKNILKEPDFDKRLMEMMQRQQHLAIEELKKEKLVQKKTYKDYLKEIKALIRTDSQEKALELLNKAVINYPYNPIIHSYLGFLEAAVNKQYAKGIKLCRESIKILKEQLPVESGFFLSVLYLNLGKTYLAANKKKEAYDAFQKGLETDKKNEEILYEIKNLGIRRRPPLPFLKRSNPLNKYIGKLTYK
jgi:tetratricopeptide (TPR) repeat protein